MSPSLILLGWQPHVGAQGCPFVAHAPSAWPRWRLDQAPAMARADVLVGRSEWRWYAGRARQVIEICRDALQDAQDGPGVTERDTGGKVATYGAGTKGRFPCWKRYFGLFRCAEAPRRGSFAVLDGTKGAPPVELTTFCLTGSPSQGYFTPVLCPWCRVP